MNTNNVMILALIVIVLVVAGYYFKTKKQSANPTSTSVTTVTLTTATTNTTPPLAYVPYDPLFMPSGFYAMFMDNLMQVRPGSDLQSTMIDLSAMARPITRVVVKNLLADVQTTEAGDTIAHHVSSTSVYDVSATATLAITGIQGNPTDVSATTHDLSTFAPYTLRNVPNGYFACAMSDGTLAQSSPLAFSSADVIQAEDGKSFKHVMTNGVSLKINTVENGLAVPVLLSGQQEFIPSSTTTIVSVTLN